MDDEARVSEAQTATLTWASSEPATWAAPLRVTALVTDDRLAARPDADVVFWDITPPASEP